MTTDERIEALEGIAKTQLEMIERLIDIVGHLNKRIDISETAILQLMGIVKQVNSNVGEIGNSLKGFPLINRQGLFL
jgi:hypothetical protein